MGRLACLVIAIALSAACARPPIVLGQRMPHGCSKTTKSERCIGWIFDRMLMTILFKPYEDDSIQNYVADIGRRLAAASNEHRAWHFKVVDEDSANGFSTFNNTIYITRGALGMLRDEAELAAIIGHEMGHTIAGHNRESILEWGDDTGQTQLEAWRELRYARDDEIQADELAVVYLARAGYDVHAVERMLRALGAGDEDEDDSDDRHPIFRERIARAAAIAGKYPEGERGGERYRERVANVVVGEDPRNIAVVSNAAVFARANLAVDIPEGALAFRIQNMVIFAWEKTGVVGTIQVIDRRLVKEMSNKDKATHTELKVTKDVALAITIVQDDKKQQDHVALAKTMIKTVRSPSPKELSHLHPARFDPTMPRPLWAN